MTIIKNRDAGYVSKLNYRLRISKMNYKVNFSRNIATDT